MAYGLIHNVSLAFPSEQFIRISVFTVRVPACRKYLRDQEREQLAEHAADMGLQCARASFRRLFKAQTPVSGTRRLYFLIDLYEAHADRPRSQDRTERGPRIAQLLEETFKLFRGGKVSGLL